MAKIQRPSKRNLSEVEAAYKEFSWQNYQPKKYEELKQVTDPDFPPNARGFIVENEVWFDEVPPDNHEAWWDDVIGENYDRHWKPEKDDGPNQIIYFRIPSSGYFQIPHPNYKLIDDETVKRAIIFMRDEIELPTDTVVTWAISDVGIMETKAGDLYEAV